MKAYSGTLDVRICDSSLRDGSHHVRHQFTPEAVATVVTALDEASIPVIEVSHGDGLGGSSFTYGHSAVDERLLIKEAVANARRAKIACLLLPGVGTTDDIRAAADLGVSIIRVATHCTEADTSIEHFTVARKLGLETVGFLIMAHSQPPEVFPPQARIMADAGCECVYVTDSAGALILEQVSDRIAAIVSELGDDASVGFHGHENLGLGVANTIAAIRAGAVQVDGCTRRFGAGAGNTPTEALVAVCGKLGIATGVDPLAMFDVAEDVVLPLMGGEPTLSRMALVMGYAGVYSSFLKHAARAAERYGVSGSEILLRCGQLRLVGGQEDRIIEIASELAAESQVVEMTNGSVPHTQGANLLG